MPKCLEFRRCALPISDCLPPAMTRAMRLCPLMFCGLAAVACDSRSDGGPPILAAGTIGPEGGVITVGSGVEAGLTIKIGRATCRVRGWVRKAAVDRNM